MTSRFAPTQRPHASWVTGRSQRWHDPEFLADLQRRELRAQLAGVRDLRALAGATTASIDAGGVVSAGRLLRMLRILWRLNTHLRNSRRRRT